MSAAAVNWFTAGPIASRYSGVADRRTMLRADPMEIMLQILDDLEDFVFSVPMLWGSLRTPVLAVLTTTLGMLLFV